MNVRHDGHYLYVDLEDCNELSLTTAIGIVSNYSVAHEIVLVGDADVRDNPNGTTTLRYKIKSIA